MCGILKHTLGRQSWGKWSALRPRVRFMDSEAGAKQVRDSFRCVNFDNQATPALPSPPTAITNASRLRLYNQTRVSSAVQENMDVAAKMARYLVLTRAQVEGPYLEVGP